MHGIKTTPLKKLLFTIIKLAKKDMANRFNNAGIGLTQLQYWVLAMAQSEPITLNEIARRFDIKPPSLIPVVDALEQAGYLQRKNDLKDRRKIQLIITAKGQKLLTKVPHDDGKDALSTAFSTLNKDKQKQLLILLKELTDNFPQQ